MHVHTRPGWTKKELQKVRRILAKAERAKPGKLIMIEHAFLWIVVLALVIVGMAFLLGFLPFLVVTSTGISVPFIFLMGTCVGLLFVHVLHDLHLETPHHHLGASVLVLGTITAIALLLATLPGRLGKPLSFWTAAFLAVTFAAGIAVTYLVHWRLTHETA